MKTQKSKQLLKAIEREVRSCRSIALRYFRSTSLKVKRKPDRSPVTEADRKIEEKLRKALKKLCPGESILGEEFGYSGMKGESYWTIDPIDGTRGFSRGLPSWGMMIGRIENGQATLGVIDYPVIDVTIAAAYGVQAYERIGTSIKPFKKVKPITSLDDAVIFHGGANWWHNTKYKKGFNRVINNCFLERAYGDCYGYLWVLRGCADAVIDQGVKPWDLVPLAALAQATGLVLTDCKGNPTFSGPEAVFGHPQTVKQIVKVLNR